MLYGGLSVLQEDSTLFTNLLGTLITEDNLQSQTSSDGCIIFPHVVFTS